jgi:hypothetical protein
MFWIEVLNFYEHPEPSEPQLVQLCLENGNTFTLAIVALEKLRRSQGNIPQQQVLCDRVLNWADQVTVAPNEECKLVLLWYIALSHLIAVVRIGGHKPRACLTVVALVLVLVTFLNPYISWMHWSDSKDAK